jgi:hypothetical protein
MAGISEDIQIIYETERHLAKLGIPTEMVTHGRRGTKSYACAKAYPPDVEMPHSRTDETERDVSDLLVKTFDVDWVKDPKTGEITRLRVIALGFGKLRLATVETKIRIALLRSALDQVKWGVSDLP